MEDFLRKFVGTIFLFATILSGVALIVVMLNFNKINPGAPTKAKTAVEEAKEGKESEALKEGEVSEEGKELEKTEEGVGAEGQMAEPAEDVEK